MGKPDPPPPPPLSRPACGPALIAWAALLTLPSFCFLQPGGCAAFSPLCQHRGGACDPEGAKNSGPCVTALSFPFLSPHKVT